MCSLKNNMWGTWKFSSNAQDKLKSLNPLFNCQSFLPEDCQSLNSKSWRLTIDAMKAKDLHGSSRTFSHHKNETDNYSGNTGINTESPVPQEDHDLPSSPDEVETEDIYIPTSNNLISEASEVSSVEDQDITLENDDILKITAEICDFLKKEPMTGLSAKAEGKEVAKVLKAIKSGLTTEENLANLLLSLCPPIEENLFEQSKWTPALYQDIILPEIMGRSSPVSRVLSSAISHLAANSPDACVHLLCIPLLSSGMREDPPGLSQPTVEVLTKIIEESLPAQQKVLLFRTFYSDTSSRGRGAMQENLFPVFLTLVESEGAFIGVEPEVLSNLIDWLELCSQDHAASIKFTKYLVATLKGIAQGLSSRRESGVSCLSAEEEVKLRNVVSQNKTFLKKIAEKSLKLLM